MRPKAVVIFSGGLDSSTLLYYARTSHDVHALTFDYGSKHNAREQAAASLIARRANVSHTIVPLPFVNELFKSDLLLRGGKIPEGHYEDVSMRRTVVPFRNGIMLAIAVGFAESIDAGVVMFAGHAGDHAIYPDCRPEFLQAIAQCARVGTYRGVVVEDPFITMKKSDIVELGNKLAVPLSLTYSCYRGEEDHCGRCGTCHERKEAFQLAGVPDPTRYES
ncbi:MAG: 7-cyano-7-deazaguanine synthase QueC [Ignavibacteria bacterium]|nr:7-cyano-7-deazaguanine synthase QueC [Ignavibacteria bacterium]